MSFATWLDLRAVILNKVVRQTGEILNGIHILESTKGQETRHLTEETHRLENNSLQGEETGVWR